MRNTLLTIHTAVIGGYALFMLVIPELFWSLFGVELTLAATVLVRVLAAHVLGNTILSWRARDVEVGRIVLPVFALVWAILFVIFLVGQLSGAMNVLGWSNVGMSLMWPIVLLWLTYGKQQNAVAKPA